MAPKGCGGNFRRGHVQPGWRVRHGYAETRSIETFGTLHFTFRPEDGKLSGQTTGDLPGSLTRTLSATTLALDPCTSSGFSLGPMQLRR
jgi:hypothetical protein